ncbi:MAG TPA: hypothetical protein PKU97_03100, partial [Kofleriaceae bacterium]|nr:hypothetical protein [Kofleriaceae bacterium]
ARAAFLPDLPAAWRCPSAHPAKTPPGAARPAPARALAKKPSQEESLNALSLVFKALAASIANFFRRLFGAKVK